jgi:hypothetical protein
VNQRVSSAIGDYIVGLTKLWHHHRLNGHNISAVSEWKCLVQVDDGSEKECSSALLTSKCPWTAVYSIECYFFRGIGGRSDGSQG